MGYTVITILIVVASILMVGIVLIQKSKGGGLSDNFSQSNKFASVAQTTDIIEKLTWGLMAFIAVLAIASVFFKNTDGAVSTANSEVQVPLSTALPTQQAAPAAPAAPVE